MSFVDPISLHGQTASLVPLSLSHHDDLVEAVKDGELWNLWYTKVPAPDQLRAEIDRRLQLQMQGSMTPFAVIEKSTGEAVGMTTFMNIDAANRRVEIGSTWYRKRVQRSALNTECKLLMLTRQHLLTSNGTLRDTCVYSILDREWPTVKAHLAHRLERP